MPSSDPCFGQANARHGVEFVSALYLARLEPRSLPPAQAGEASDATGGKRFLAGALFLDGAVPHQAKGSAALSSADLLTAEQREQRRNARWALERVVALPLSADASRWLADVNRCRLRLAGSAGRSTLPLLSDAVPARPLSIVPVETRPLQQDGVDASAPQFEYLLLREAVPPPASKRVRQLFESAPASEADGNVKRVAVAADGDSSRTAAVPVARDTVHLHVSSPAALCAPRNHNEVVERMARPWLSTRVAVRNAPRYSLLGGVALDLDAVDLPRSGEETSVPAASMMLLGSCGLDRALLPAGCCARPDDDEENGGGSADPFAPRPIASAAVELQDRLESLDSSDADVRAARRERERRDEEPTFEQRNLHARIQRGYDAQFLVETHDRDAARDRVLDKLSASPEYALCYDLLQDADIATAGREPVHHAHEIHSGEQGRFALSRLLGEGDSLRRRSAAQRITRLFGLRAAGDNDDALAAAASSPSSFIASMLYDGIVAPIFSRDGLGLQLLTATAAANPIGLRQDREAFFAAHAVLNNSRNNSSSADAAAAADAVKRSEDGSSPPSVIGSILRLLPRPWLVDITSKKSKDAPHFLTAEVDSYLAGKCELVFASAPQWSFFAAWKDRAIAQNPLSGFAAQSTVADVVAVPTSQARAVSPSLRGGGGAPAQTQLQHLSPAGASVTTPQRPNARELPPLSPPPSGAALPGMTMPAAAVRRDGHATPGAFSTPRRTPATVPATSPPAEPHSQQHAAAAPAASSAFSPAAYTSRITASTRRHFDAEFLSSPRGIAHAKQHRSLAAPQQQGGPRAVHVADGRTVEVGANYHYRWDRAWEVDDGDSDDAALLAATADERMRRVVAKPMPAFWDRLELRGVASLLYGVARRAGELDSDVADFHHRRDDASRSHQPLFSPGRRDEQQPQQQQQGAFSPGAGAGGDGAPLFTPPSRARTRQEERAACRTYLGESAVPPGDGSSRFYSMLHMSASWIAEKTLWSPSSLLRLRGGCRWALASDASAVPTLDEKNRQDDATSLLLRGSPFLNHFFTAGQTAPMVRRQQQQQEAGATSAHLRQHQQQMKQLESLSTVASSSTCVHQPQGAFVLELEQLLPRGLRSNLFLGATASCHVLSGYDYLAAINAEILRGPNYASQLFGAPMLVAPSVARAAESRAKGSGGTAAPTASYARGGTYGGAAGSALSGFSLSTNLRALAEVVAGVSVCVPVLGNAPDVLGERPRETQDLGQRLEIAWWWPLFSVDSLRAGSSSSAASSARGGTPATHRFGLSLFL